VTGVYNAAAQTMDVYLNGVLDDGALVGTVTASQQNSTLPVVIGKRSGLSGFEFNGRIDEVRLYNNTLTQSQIQTDMNTPLDAAAPAVALTAPAPGSTATGTVTVSATASDNVRVAGVQFKLDGANLGAEDTAAPYSVSWNTLTAANGPHTLTAVARDPPRNPATATAGGRAAWKDRDPAAPAPPHTTPPARP